MAGVTRPRGATVNPERRQKRLHPDHRNAQESVLNDGKTFQKKATADAEGKPSANGASTSEGAKPVPQTPPNNITAPPNSTGAVPADQTKP